MQVNASTLAIGKKAYRLGDFDKAFQIFASLAQEGNASAQYGLGIMYDEGKGVPQDYKEAVKWKTKSAEQGIVYAQSDLGVMYKNGLGVPQDYKEAIKWYRRAAEQNYIEAQRNLGIIYWDTKSGAFNLAQSYMWLNLAAAQGDELAKKEISNQLKIGYSSDFIVDGQKLIRLWKIKKELFEKWESTNQASEP